MAALLPPSRSILLLALAIYLAGVATPIFVLRSLASDRNDSCLLNLLLTIVLALAGGLLLLIVL